MNDLKITKGVAYAEKHKNSWTVNCGIYPVATRSGWLPGLDEENLANADVIAETFNVAYETGLTPKQLLDQRDALLSVLKGLIDRYDPENPGAAFYSDPGCVHCTSGATPNRLNTGPCPYHKALAAIAKSGGAS